MPDDPMFFPTTPSNDDKLSRIWCEESERYVSAINDYVSRGIREGWENVKEQEPQDTRGPMAGAVLDAVRRANQSGRTDGLHERFPRAHAPFLEMLEDNGQSLPVVLLLDDGRILIRVGPPYEPGHVVIIDDRKWTPLSPDIITIGRSPNRNFFAIARKEGVSIHRGWEGPKHASLRWPTGREGIPGGSNTEIILDAPIITRLIPFDTGDRALLVGPQGIFVISQSKAIRLLPTKDEMREHFDWLRKEHPNNPLSYNLSMEHGTISPDGRWIATGSQDGSHYVFDANSLSIASEIGPQSDYPHCAVFSMDGSVVAFNSCHFYNGVTIGVPTFLLRGLRTEPYELDNRLTLLENEARVYAAVSRDDEFIIGDATGYLRAFDLKGKFRWQHFLGSSIGDIDVSRNGKRLVVTTYAGFLCILDLDTGEPDPFTIGTGTHRERRRWLFWRTEPRPLIW